MPPAYLAQRLTLFADDDVTPLLGGAEGTFSTDKTHPRPYLQFSQSLGEAEINFIEGTSSIGQANLTVLDKRTVPTDQSTGIFTGLMASAATGDTQILRRHVLWEGLASDNVTWVTILDGVLDSYSLNEDLVSYDLVLRDIRERERVVRLFENAGDTTAIFPRVGPIKGWGFQTGYDSGAGRVVFNPSVFPTYPRMVGAYGVVKASTFPGAPWRFVSFAYDTPLDRITNRWLVDGLKEYEELWAKFGQPLPVASDNGVFTRYAWTQIIVEWSLDSITWNRLPTMPYPLAGPLIDTPSAIIIREYPGLDPNADPIIYARRVDSVILSADNTALLPPVGANVYVRILPNAPPSDDVPYFLEEESFGKLLRKCYDGDYSDPAYPPRVLYSETAMSLMEAETPPVLGKVTGVVEDMRTWVQENIYKPTGYAPALDPDGRVTPIKYALPGADVPLLQLTKNNVRSASWEHTSAYAINKVTFDYERDLIPNSFYWRPPMLPGARTKILTQPVHLEAQNPNSLALFNAKVIAYKPDTVRSAIVSSSNVGNANLQNEAGWRLAMARMADVISRFGQSAQECSVVASALDIGVASAKAGDWVVLSVPWLPDYITRKRGIARLMQITRIRKSDPITREFTLLDAGPVGNPSLMPTVTNIQQTSDGRVTVDLTAIPAGVTARLEYAVGDTEPDATSGAWTLMVRTTLTGTYSTPPLNPGSTVWVRWRGEVDGQRPSAWGGPLSITLTTGAGLEGVRLIIVDGVPVVSWTPTGTTVGVRIYYQRHADGTPIPSVLSSSVDVLASLGTYSLPMVLEPREQITVRVAAYPGFSGGAVSGAVGYISDYLNAQRLGDTLGVPIVLPRVVIASDKLSADVFLTVTSPNDLEKLSVQVKGDSGAVYVLVVANGDSTTRYVDSGTTVGPTDWFWNGTVFAQRLNDIALTPGVPTRLYAQAIGKVSGNRSGWVTIPLDAAPDVGTGDEVLLGAVSPRFPDGRVVTDTATNAWDLSAAGIAKVSVKDNSLAVDKLNATGTRDATTFLRGDNTFAVPPGSGGGGGGSGSPITSYLTATFTSSSLADGASEVIPVNFAKSAAFQEITTNFPAWVRIHPTNASATGDLGRAYNADPVFGSDTAPNVEAGCGLDSYSLTAALRQNVLSHNMENPRQGRFFVIVTNKSGATRTITVNIKYLPFEGAAGVVTGDFTAGLLYHYDAQALTGLANLDPLPSWPMVTGAGDTTNGGTPYPVYDTTGINGKPSVKFVGARFHALPVCPAFTEAEVFVVARRASGGDSALYQLGNDGFPTSIPYTLDGAAAASDNFARNGQVNVGNVGKPTNVGFIWNVSSKTDEWTVRVNGTQIYQTLVNTVVNRADKQIGGYNQGGFFQLGWNGWYGEFRMYNSKLTDAQRADVNFILSDKWSISL